MRYVVVSPVKNEAEHIENTLRSMETQTLLPLKWVIVDDGSTDETPSILREFASRHDWVHIITNPTHQESRAGGSKVVRAFYKGYPEVSEINYDFIVKLDGDLGLPSDYFERIAQAFQEDERVGLCGGLIYNVINGQHISEGEADYHVRGAFKAIRKACWLEIGGFRPLWNWDGLDEMDAMRLGWKTRVLDLKVLHYRPTSGAYNPIRQQWKDGKDAYRLRSSFLLTVIRTAARFRIRPYGLAGLSYFSGYLQGFLSREPVSIEPELVIFINRFHRKRILGF